MYKSNRLCCVCQKRGDHIHHLDRDRTNGKEDNLALLCFDCHDEATRTTGLRRKLSSGEIRLHRDNHYDTVEAKRRRDRTVVDERIDVLTEETLVRASLTASILLKIDRIEYDCFGASQEEKFELLRQLSLFSEHSNLRISYAVFEFLSSLAHTARSGMRREVAGSIGSLVHLFFPWSKEESNIEKVHAIGKLAIDAGSSITYDSFIHGNDLWLTIEGLQILKTVHIHAHRKGFSELKEDVQKEFEALVAHAQRPGRSDLSMAKELIESYREHLADNDLTLPIFSPRIMQALYPTR